MLKSNYKADSSFPLCKNLALDIRFIATASNQKNLFNRWVTFTQNKIIVLIEMLTTLSNYCQYE